MVPSSFLNCQFEAMAESRQHKVMKRWFEDTHLRSRYRSACLVPDLINLYGLRTKLLTVDPLRSLHLGAYD